MNIDFTARRIKLSPKVREIVEKKLEKLSRVLPSDAQAHVIVQAEKKGVSVEVTVVGHQRTWTAAETEADQETATHAVLDRIAAQAKKTKGRVKEDKKHTVSTVRTMDAPVVPEAAGGNGRSRATRAAAAARETIGGPRRESVQARPMFEEDALDAFSGGVREVLVYRDASSDEAFRVLYRRRDGSVGLLIPV